MAKATASTMRELKELGRIEIGALVEALRAEVDFLKNETRQGHVKVGVDRHGDLVCGDCLDHLEEEDRKSAIHAMTKVDEGIGIRCGPCAGLV